jgi:hypothetical protein
MTVGPAMTAAPTVLGAVAVGKRVTGLSGTWAGSGPITYRFQWYRCNAAGAHCLSVHGATSPTYALVVRDVGKTVGMTVRATDSTGTAAAYSSLIGPVAAARPLLESTVQPAISGPPVEGKSVEVSTGTWSPTPTKVTYTWERCNSNGRVCAAIPNATGNSYKLAAADVGHALVVLVQATFGATTQNTLSAATPAAVDASVVGPTAIAAPGITGTAARGERLVAAPGIWKGVGPVGYGFQWYRCDTTGSHCGSIHGATGGTYRIVAKDVGKVIGLTLRATDSTGVVSAYTSLLGPIADRPSPLSATAQPVLTGTARTGETLTVSSGVWTETPAAYTYGWLRCNANRRLCAAIPTASAATYTVTSADTGHTLIAVVSAKLGAAVQSALSTGSAKAS